MTLVELLVAVSIISMLTALLLPPVGRIRRQARSIVRMQRLREITTAVNPYAADNHDWYHPSVATVGVLDS